MEKATVYFTKNLNSESLLKIYDGCLLLQPLDQLLLNVLDIYKPLHFHPICQRYHQVQPICDKRYSHQNQRIAMLHAVGYTHRVYHCRKIIYTFILIFLLVSFYIMIAERKKKWLVVKLV